MGHQRGEFAPFNDPVAVDIERLHDCSHLFRVGKHPQLSKDRCYLFAVTVHTNTNGNPSGLEGMRASGAGEGTRQLGGVHRAAAVDIKLPKSGSELLLLSRRE
jgi:hypothetical protein